MPGQVVLGFGDRILAVMKNAGGQGGAGTGLGQSGPQVLGTPGPARGDHRNLYGLDHRAGHLQVVAVFGSVGVHAGQDDLAGSQSLDFASPGHSLQSGRNPAAVDVNFPEFATARASLAWGRC